MKALKAFSFSAFFLLLAVSVIELHAQQAPYIPNIMPPSPVASTLIKYSDFPVSTYTGAADVSIPIYTIQARGMSVPVSLSYNTGGVRVKDESGWVGLGWACNSGGMISRTIMDKDDFTSGYFNVALPQIVNKTINSQTSYAQKPFMGQYTYDFFCNYQVNTDAGVVDFSSAWPNGAPSVNDMESDIYNFNFPGRSGKFVITRAGTVLVQNQENLKFQFETNSNSFTITDDHGNQYYFADKEYSANPSGVGLSVSSWYLSRIITQLNDTIRYNYTVPNSYTFVPGDLHETNRVSSCATGYFGSTMATYQYLNITLQNIDFSNGQLQFSFDSTRQDLQNGKKLNSIKIYSKDAAGTLIYIKENQLYYSYFNTGQGYEYARLRLDSVKEVSGTALLPPYSFTYRTASVAKHSKSVDHWGFYNGAGNSTFIPTFNDLYSPQGATPQFLNIAGANRFPDSSYMKAFSLTQVQFPTGGRKVFEYDPNYYDLTASTPGAADFNFLPHVDVTSTPTISARGTTTGSVDLSKMYIPYGATLTVTFRDANNGGLTQYQGTNGKIYFTIFGITTDISNSNLTCQFSICATPLINTGVSSRAIYNWTAYIDPSIPADFLDITVNVHWQELYTEHYNTQTLMAGGLRMNTVTDYNSDNSIAAKKRYDYGYSQDVLGTGIPQSYSYGRLMSSPSYARYEPIYNGAQTLNCTSLTLYGSSVNTLTSCIKGNIVGYDQVAEYTIDPVTGVDIGKTIYKYINSSDISGPTGGYRLPGLLNTGNNLVGNLIQKQVYSNVSGKYVEVSETNYYYRTANTNTVYSLKVNFLTSTSGTSSYCPNNTCVPSELVAAFYPAIKSERVLLDSTREVVFDQSGNGASSANTVANFYDNTLHYQLTRSRMVDSKGNTTASYLKYPQDYIPNGNNITNNTILDNMINRNMLAETIEKRDSFYYYGSSTGYIKGAQLSKYKTLTGSIMGLDKQYNLDIQSPVTDFQPYAISGNSSSQDSRYRQMISFDAYDNLNNYQQYTATDQLPVSYIWDYKQVYPIAQVKNGAINEVAYTSFEADGTGGWTMNDAARNTTYKVTGSQSYPISTGKTISKSGLTSGKTYIVSYWSRNGAITVNGVSATQGMTKNGWTYYQHLLPNTTTSVSITGNATIDELRLYPGNAQMVSYTYKPLVGMTSACSAANLIQNYVYDPFGRLKQIIDQDGNILKTIEYHYQNQVGFNP